MIWIIYKIIDSGTSKTIHIGETVNPIRRLKEHKKKYKGYNLEMVILPTFYYSKKDAYSAQIELQKKYNIISDDDKTYIGFQKWKEKKSKSFLEKRKKEAIKNLTNNLG